MYHDVDKHLGWMHSRNRSCNSLVPFPKHNSEEIIIDSLQVGSTCVSGGILIPRFWKMPFSNGMNSFVDDSEITILMMPTNLVEFDYNNTIEGRHKLEISGKTIVGFPFLYLPAWNDDLIGMKQPSTSSSSMVLQWWFWQRRWPRFLKWLTIWGWLRCHWWSDYWRSRSKILWLTSPQSNPDGIYDGKCDGYHGLSRRARASDRPGGSFGDKMHCWIADKVPNETYESFRLVEIRNGNQSLCGRTSEWFTNYQWWKWHWTKPRNPLFALIFQRFLLCLEPIGQMLRCVVLPRSTIWWISRRCCQTHPYGAPKFQTQTPRELKMKILILHCGETFQEILLLNFILVKQCSMVSLIWLYWNIWCSEGMNLVWSRKCLSKKCFDLWRCKMSSFWQHDVERFIRCRWWCCFPCGDGLCPNGYWRGLLSPH